MSSYEFLLVDQNAPFLVAGAVTLLIAAVEVASLLLGFGLSNLIDDLLPDFDPEPDFDGPDLDGVDSFDAAEANVFVQAFAWLNVGRVPFLVLLLSYLAVFTVAGLVLQSAASAAIGLIPAWIAGPAAGLAALPATRLTSRLLARIMPREETYAVGEEQFIGRTASITLGPVDAETAGKAKLVDQFGNVHFVRVRAANAGERYQVGSEVLLVRRDDAVFAVIATPESVT